MTEVEAKELERLRAAEEVCWTLLLQMGLGLLTIEDAKVRTFLAEPMLTWADLAVETGILREEEAT